MKRFAVFPLLVVNSCTGSPQSQSLPQCVDAHLRAIRNVPTVADATQRFQSLCYQMISSDQQLRLMAARAQIYEQQLHENCVLMWMVVGLTIAGVLLAGLQLLASYFLATRGEGALAEGGDLSVGRGNVAVKSSVVGVVILVISLAFFGIFVTDVYTIHDPNTPAAAPTPEISKPPPNMTQVAK